MSADRAQANQGVGNVPKPIPASQRDALSFQNTWEITVENGQQAKQSQRSSFSFQKKHSEPQDLIVYTDGSVPKCQGASPSSKVRLPSMKTVQSTRSQPPCLPWVASRGDIQITHAIILTKSEKWNGKPRLECVDGRHPPSKTPVGVLPCMPE